MKSNDYNSRRFLGEKDPALIPEPNLLGQTRALAYMPAYKGVTQEARDVFLAATLEPWEFTKPDDQAANFHVLWGQWIWFLQTYSDTRKYFPLYQPIGKISFQKFILGTLRLQPGDLIRKNSRGVRTAFLPNFSVKMSTNWEGKYDNLWCWVPWGGNHPFNGGNQYNPANPIDPRWTVMEYHKNLVYKNWYHREINMVADMVHVCNNWGPNVIPITPKVAHTCEIDENGAVTWPD